MYARPMPWEPVLDGRLADEARAAVRAIAEDVGRLEPARRSPVDEALLWAYVAGAFDDAGTASRFEDAVAALHERLEAPFSSLGCTAGSPARAGCSRTSATALTSSSPRSTAR